MIVSRQSISEGCPDAPESLKVSNELDIYPRTNWEKLSDLIDGSIGEGSPFNETFGYYAQDADPHTAVLPAGGEGRLTQVQSPGTGDGIGYCIDVHDLALSQYVADREKDRMFNRELIRYRMVDLVKPRKCVDLLPVTETRKELILAAIVRDENAVADESPPGSASNPRPGKTPQARPMDAASVAPNLKLFTRLPGRSDKRHPVRLLGRGLRWPHQRSASPWRLTRGRPSDNSRLGPIAGMSIEHFVRQVCYQSLPAPLLPGALQNDNPLKLPRVYDGSLETV